MMAVSQQNSEASRVWKDGVLARCLFAAAVVVGLSLLGGIDFLAFHLVAELATVMVSMLVFVVAVGTYRFNRNNYLLYVGGAWFWVALLDLMHILTYRGMGLLGVSTANISTQFWLSARLVEAAALLVAPRFLRRHHTLRLVDVMVGHGWVAIAMTTAIFTGLFPDGFRDGSGLTPFKILTEWAIIAALALSIVHLQRCRNLLSGGVAGLMSAAAVLAIVTEALFTVYTGTSGIVNLLGHLAKFLSFWLVFEALVRTTINHPFVSRGSSGAAVFDGVPFPVLLVSQEGVILHANSQASQWAGYPAELMSGQLLGDFYRSQDATAGVSSRIGLAVREMQALEGEDIVLNAGEEGERVCQVSLAPVTWVHEKGDSALMLTLRDISAQRQTARELTLSLQRLELLVEAGGQGLWDWDISSGIASYSREILSRLGYEDTGEARTLQYWQRLIHPDDLGQVMAALNAHLDGRTELYESEYRVRTNTNEWAWLHSIGRVIEHDSQGHPSRAIGLHRNVTAQKSHQSALESSNADLQDFAYVASHDLKEPLRTISRFLGLLELRYGNRLDEEGMEFLSFARSGAERLSGMIDDLLEYSRVDHVQVQFSRIDMADMAAMVVSRLSAAIDRSRASVMTEGDLREVVSDRHLLLRVLQNLVSNAVKYHSPERLPEVVIRATECGPLWRIDVCDNGIGMTAEECGQVFHIFRRLHTGDQYEGNGIGLAIVKRVVERLGGTVSVSSTPGAGSVFSLALPKYHLKDDQVLPHSLSGIVSPSS